MTPDSPADQARTARLLEAFRARYEGDPVVVRAPGRVNLIGEHTDYNDGFVLPIAVERDVRFAAAKRSDRVVRLYSLDYEAETVFDLDDLQRDEANSWGNYVRGMAVQLLGQGLLLHGMDGVIEGNVPIGSGLSSSAAMEVAAGMAFLATSKQVVDPPLLARLAQAAENEYMGVRVGIMDQFASRLGHQGHALFLDCRSLEYRLIPVPEGECVFVVADSKQSRELAGSAYNERRAQCEAAVEALKCLRPQVTALRDVEPADLDRLRGDMDPVVYRRARHVVTENDRVCQAVKALSCGDLDRFGKLMDESHDSLRDDYEVSSPGLEALVRAARAVEGCLGSRLTGAGFGGCTVSLVRAERVEAFMEQVREGYRQATGVEADLFVTRPAAGAGMVSVDAA